MPITDEYQLRSALSELEVWITSNSGEEGIERAEELMKEMIEFKKTSNDFQNYIRLIENFPLVQIKTATQYEKSRSVYSELKKRVLSYWEEQYKSALYILLLNYERNEEDPWD